MAAEEIHGRFNGIDFYIAGDEFEVALYALGWEILLAQSPKPNPKFKRLGGRVKYVDALYPAFVERATSFCSSMGAACMPR